MERWYERRASDARQSCRAQPLPAGWMMKRKRLTIENRREITGYLFILPWILGFLLFFLSPITDSLLFSFQHVTLEEGSISRPFAGLLYYRNAFFSDEKFLPYFLASFQNLLVELPIILIFSLFIAVLLNQNFRGRGFVRSMFFLPLMLSSTVLLSIINGDAVAQGVSDTGSVYMAGTASMDQILLQMGLPDDLITYLTGLIDRIFNIIWQSGIQILLFLTALQSVSPSLKEAADVEGATAWEYFWKITVPIISPMILVNILFTIIDTFTSYNNSLMRYILDEASQLRYSYSSAMTWIYFAAIGLVMLLVVGIASRFVHYENE